MKKILTLLTIGIVGLISCKKDEIPYSGTSKYFTSSTTGPISAFGTKITLSGGFTMTYTLTGDYLAKYHPNVAVSCDESWCHYSYEISEYNIGYELTIGVHVYFYLENNSSNESRSAIFSIRMDNEQDAVTITQLGISEVIVSAPGGLTQELADKDLLYATSLKISGELNDNDLETIKGLREIETLDLTEAVINDLPDEMFYQNETIKNIKLPNSITTIHPKTFAFSSLEYVYIPTNIRTIEDGQDNSYSYDEEWKYVGAFANTNLNTVEFAEDSKLKYVGIGTFAGAGKENRKNSNGDIYCETLTIMFPAGLETIANNAFTENGNNKTLANRFSEISVSFEEQSALKTIGNTNAHSIDYDASNCTKIESVGYIGSPGKITVAIGTQTPPLFSGVSSGATLYVPKGCVGAYYEADGWKEFETIKEIGQE